MGPIVLPDAAVDEVVTVLALIPLMSMNLRAKWDDEVVVTDASPSGGGAAVATRFKREPDTVDHQGQECFQCDKVFGDDDRYPCPSGCGSALCSLHCIRHHREAVCPSREICGAKCPPQPCGGKGWWERGPGALRLVPGP